MFYVLDNYPGVVLFDPIVPHTGRNHQLSWQTMGSEAVQRKVGNKMTIVSHYKSRARGSKTASARGHMKWAGVLCCGALLAPTAWTQAEDIDFVIDSGQVVPTEDFAVKISVLGAAITSSGTDMPVTVQINVNGQSLEPFGPSDDPSQGDVNDHSAPRHFIVQEVFDPASTIDITGTSWHNGDVYLQKNSHDQSPSVIVLRNGDPVPAIDGFDGQTDAVEFVQQYIDTESGTMTLDVNQSIYLFEIGTTRLTSSAADFQDLVVLVTLGKTPADLEDATFADASFD